MDLDWFGRSQPLGWQRFIEQVALQRVRTSVYFSLAIPKELFNTPIPDHVLNALRPAAWNLVSSIPEKVPFLPGEAPTLPD
jgi:hypothetical protein